MPNNIEGEGMMKLVVGGILPKWETAGGMELAWPFKELANKTSQEKIYSRNIFI